MARRDYAARSGSKKKKQTKKSRSLLISLAVLVLVGFAGVLYLLKEKAPEAPVELPEVAEKKQPKSVLPNRPEEVWGYIKALETRTVPVNDNPSSIDKNMQLTPQQKQILLEMEKEQKAAEERRRAEALGLTANATAENSAESPKSETSAKVETAKAENVKSADVQKLEAQKLEAQKAEQAKKVAEAKKLAEARKAAELKAAETAKTENKKAEAPKTAPIENAVAGEKKYGLQCGTFKSRENAENLQARLVMTGLNARVNTSGEYSRVQVGPVGDRNAAVKAQEKARSIIGCVVIGM